MKSSDGRDGRCLVRLRFLGVAGRNDDAAGHAEERKRSCDRSHAQASIPSDGNSHYKSKLYTAKST